MVDPRRIFVHQSLGGGAVADVLMWRRIPAALFLLVSSSTLWFLFERGGYNLLGFIANVLLLLVTILFFWAKSASLLNRPLPPIPNLEMSEDAVFKAVEELRVWINHGLSLARDIAIARNVKRFIQVAVSLWFISYVGSLFNFLTLVYIEVLLSLSVPLVYDKYQDHIDDKLTIVHGVLLTQYRKIDEKSSQKNSNSCWQGKEDTVDRIFGPYSKGLAGILFVKSQSSGQRKLGHRPGTITNSSAFDEIRFPEARQ